MTDKPSKSLLHKILGTRVATMRIRLPHWQQHLVPQRERFYIVLGVPRSGTTLLCSKLAGQQNSVCLDEPWLHWQRFGKFPLPARAITTMGDHGPWSTAFPAEALTRLATTFDHVGIKETFRTGSYWPGYGNVELLDRFANLVAEGRTLAIIRNPLAVWNSVRNRRLARTHAEDKAVSSRFTGNWNALCEWVEKKGIQSIRYEDLVQRPDEVFSGLCERLGIRFDPDMLGPDEGAKPEKPGHPATRGVHAESERRYETELPARDAEFIRRECGELMKRFGYENAPGPG